MRLKKKIKAVLLSVARTPVMMGCALIATCCLTGSVSSQQLNAAKPSTREAEATFRISPSDYDRYLSAVNLKNWDDGGDLSRFVNLRTSLVLPAASIPRTGPVSILRSEPDRALSTYQVHLADGRVMSFDQFVNQVAMVDGIVIVHHGRIVYERSPHMDQSDKHLLFSVTKAYIGTLVGLLEADGLINIERPIETYIPELTGTSWAGTPIREILDMASGIAAPDGDIENPKPALPTRSQPRVAGDDSRPAGEREGMADLRLHQDAWPGGCSWENFCLFLGEHPCSRVVD